jgi:dihydroorotase
VLTEASYNTLRSTGQNPLVAALSSIPEEEIEMALQTDWTMIGSDAIPDPAREVINGQPAFVNNHPRASGCFARTLGRYSREREVIDLPTALAKMTIVPARRLEAASPLLARKGRVQRGADADLTVFDPERVLDTSTIEEPAKESEGISYVLVMGQVVVDPDGAKRDVLPGQALRA